MDNRTGMVFHDLMKKGWIDRLDNPEAWESYQDLDIKEELSVLGDEVGFEVERVGDRVYLIPTQDNDLFLKNNIDYRRDIKAGNDVKVRDLNLMNYLAIYFIFLNFSGEGADIRVRDFITKDEFVERFTEHCKTAEVQPIEDEGVLENYGDSFIKLAEMWLTKTDGNSDSNSISCKYGVLNKVLRKFDSDNLFTERENRIEPTRKLKDLMPYFLRKERLQVINNWFEKEEK